MDVQIEIHNVARDNPPHNTMLRAVVTNPLPACTLAGLIEFSWTCTTVPEGNTWIGGRSRATDLTNNQLPLPAQHRQERSPPTAGRFAMLHSSTHWREKRIWWWRAEKIARALSPPITMSTTWRARSKNTVACSRPRSTIPRAGKKNSRLYFSAHHRHLAEHHARRHHCTGTTTVRPPAKRCRRWQISCPAAELNRCCWWWCSQKRGQFIAESPNEQRRIPFLPHARSSEGFRAGQVHAAKSMLQLSAFRAQAKVGPLTPERKTVGYRTCGLSITPEQ